MWIALQYVDGTDAEAALRAGRMTPHRAVHIVDEVARALDYAHQRNVVHHDVKPPNLLLSDEIGDGERMFLSDCGVARPIDTERSMDGALTATLAYSAPEVITGEQIDGRADLYSLGCTLFRLLTGKQPYFSGRGCGGHHPSSSAAGSAKCLRSFVRATPDLDVVIAKALAKDPEQRFASAQEFAAAAAQAMRQASPPAGLRRRDDPLDDCRLPRQHPVPGCVAAQRHPDRAGRNALLRCWRRQGRDRVDDRL